MPWERFSVLCSLSVSSSCRYGKHIMECCWVTLQTLYTNLNKIGCILWMYKVCVFCNKVAKTWWLQQETFLVLKSRSQQHSSLDDLRLVPVSGGRHNPRRSQAHTHVAHGRLLPVCWPVTFPLCLCLWIQISLLYEDTSHTGREPTLIICFNLITIRNTPTFSSQITTMALVQSYEYDLTSPTTSVSVPDYHWRRLAVWSYPRHPSFFLWTSVPHTF